MVTINDLARQSKVGRKALSGRKTRRCGYLTILCTDLAVSFLVPGLPVRDVAVGLTLVQVMDGWRFPICCRLVMCKAFTTLAKWCRRRSIFIDINIIALTTNKMPFLPFFDHFFYFHSICLK